MTAAIQHRTSGPAHRGQSRFFASRIWRRAPRHHDARPENRVAGPKTAPRKIFSTTAKTHLENASQTLGTHQENYVWAYDFASGCAVAPNSAPTGSTNVQAPGLPGSSPVTGPIENINAGKYHILTDGTKVQILVKVDYQGSAATPAVVAKFNQGIETGWTGQFGKYSVRTLVSQVSDGPRFMPFIAPGEGRSNMNGTGLWYAAADGPTAAHEIGHGFGLPDRYQFHVRGNPPMPGYENNIMATRGGVPSGADIENILALARAREGRGP